MLGGWRGGTNKGRKIEQRSKRIQFSLPSIEVVLYWYVFVKFVFNWQLYFNIGSVGCHNAKKMVNVMFFEREIRTNIHFFATSVAVILEIWLQNRERKKFAA